MSLGRSQERSPTKSHRKSHYPNAAFEDSQLLAQKDQERLPQRPRERSRARSQERSPNSSQRRPQKDCQERDGKELEHPKETKKRHRETTPEQKHGSHTVPKRARCDSGCANTALPRTTETIRKRAKQEETVVCEDKPKHKATNNIAAKESEPHEQEGPCRLDERQHGELASAAHGSQNLKEVFAPQLIKSQPKTIIGSQQEPPPNKVSHSCDEQFSFFWSQKSPFSQWHPCTFKYGGFQYCSAEQYMMHQKAVLFGDLSIANQIMKTSSPKEQKQLGRKVKGFDERVWQQKCLEIVKTGNMLKFQQNPKLFDILTATGATTMVEASPYDTIWGIGLAQHDPRARSRKTWRGKNLLGQALTEVRDFLLKRRAQL